MRSGCACGAFERMTTVTRTPFSASMRELEGVVAAADHGDVRAQIDARLADRGCAEMEAARRRNAPRVLDAIEPLLARESRAGRDHDGRARQ